MFCVFCFVLFCFTVVLPLFCRYGSYGSLKGFVPLEWISMCLAEIAKLGFVNTARSLLDKHCPCLHAVK